MSIKETLSALGNDEQWQKTRKFIPAGFEPGVEFDVASGGVLRTMPKPAGSEPDASAMFAEFDLDPAQWKITTVRRSKWQRWDGEWLESFRVSFVPAGGVSNNVPIDDLLEIVNKWKPRNTPRTPTEARTGGLAYVCILADTQFGKSDGGGSEAIIENVLTKIDASVIRLKELRKTGRQIDTIYLPQLGDCIEGGQSQGGKLVFRLDLDITQQIRVYRRVLLHMIKAFAPLAERVIVPVVPGNHDEALRIGNQMATTYTDSFALDAASAVADALQDHPDFKHVSFVFPKFDTMTVTLNMAGTVVGMAHGHQARGKIIDWWKNQAHGQKDIGEATLLLTGHYHHLHLEQSGRKTWLQVPALDSGSTWFENSTGQAAPAGMATLVVGNGGWQDLAIL